MAGRILRDVDTQIDFVHAEGKLAVPGAGGVRVAGVDAALSSR